MKINTLIALSDAEKELLAKQCFKEFCDCINKCNYDRLKLLRTCELPVEKKSVSFELNKLCRTINKNEQRAFALCKVLIKYGSRTHFERMSAEKYSMSLFYDERAKIMFYDERNDRNVCVWNDFSNIDKLALYVMCRAGIVSKQERDRIIQMHKYSGELDKNRKKFKLISRTIDKIYELKKLIRDDSAFDLIMKIASNSIEGKSST